MTFVFAALALLAASPPAVAQQSASQPPAAPAPAQPDDNKKVCRREQATGSLMTRQTCHTKREWTAIDADNQRATQAMDNRNRATGAP